MCLEEVGQVSRGFYWSQRDNIESTVDAFTVETAATEGSYKTVKAARAAI